jgi:hypothetical protein
MSWNLERQQSRDVGERMQDRAQKIGLGAKQSAAGKKQSEVKLTLEELDRQAEENDQSIVEMAGFKPAPEFTEADAKNDTRSLNRKVGFVWLRFAL